MNRFVLAIKSFWNVLADKDFAGRAVTLFQPVVGEGPDLSVLAVLQRDGRLIDFLMENLDAYSDDQVGAAARDIHRGCRKALQEYLGLEPVIAQEEESRVTVAPQFDPATVRLTGNLAGSPPYHGTLKHHGWRVKSVHLPAIPRARNHTTILAPAEVEVA